MNVKFFIDRPVLAIVTSISFIIAGVIGLSVLPVQQYPDIAPPTVQVSASYPGASAETILKSVVAPLEEAINGVENMMYMSSSATNSGSASIAIYFRQGTNADMAAVNVQNRVSKATASLPAEVNQIGVTTLKRQSSMLRTFSIYSPNATYDEGFLSNYLKINVQPEILRIAGVGELRVLGPDYSMRLWLKPDVMAQYKLVPSDITNALSEQNIEAATGSLGENFDGTNQYVMKYSGRLEHPEQFGEMVLRALPDGEILRVKDVAEIELGRETYAFDGAMDNRPGVTCLVYQTAGSNATEVNQNIDRFFEEIRKTLPPGVEIVSLMNSNDFLFASIGEVIKTLIIAILLVILVVYFFLQDIRSTIVPSVAIIVSLIGTFAFLAAAGFSLNLLTLFALVLAIGTVVDDAIVVVEAVQARFDIGYKSSYAASVDAMRGLVSPIITTSLVFLAVFIPVSFMSGTSGTFYTQFGITMSIAVAISTVNALTLSPVLCALLLKPSEASMHGKKTFAMRMRTAYNASFNAVLGKYKRGVLFFIRRRWLVWSSLGLAVVALIVLMNTTKTGFVPDEDTGSVFVNVTTPPGSSLAETKRTMDEISTRISTIPELDHCAKVSGFGLISGQGSTSGMFILRLKHWDQRPTAANSVKAVIGQVYGRTSDIKNANVFAFAPGMIPGYGTGNGFEMHVQDRKGSDMEVLNGVTQGFLAKLRERPEIATVYSTFNMNYPQYLVEVDAVKCKRAGVSPRDVLSVMSGYYGSIYASNINRFTKVYRVMIQSDPKYRMDAESLNQIFVRIGNEMAPLSQFVTLTRVYGAESLSRFNMYNSIAVNGIAAPGYSSGDAIAAIKEVAAADLPVGYGFEFGGITREENETANTTGIIFIICLVFVYLILSALYESFFIPFAVLLSVPFGLAGSFMFAKFMGMENNIYLQTGLIMLIGLLAKTAILLTEYATERRESGLTLSQAAISAAKVRLRPILMTALTMIFGMLPMMAASGVGANGNSHLGTSVVGGMLVGTLAMLFIVPAMFIVFQHIQEVVMPGKSKHPVDDPLIYDEINKHLAEKEKVVAEKENTIG